MRSWKTTRTIYVGGEPTPQKVILVEGPNIAKMNGWDALGPRRQSELLVDANRWRADHHLSQFEAFFRYYEIDETGQVLRWHEEYSFSLEDDLWATSFIAIGTTLWEFKHLLQYGESPKLSVTAIFDDMECFDLPDGLRIHE